MTFTIHSYNNTFKIEIGKDVFIIAELGSTHCASKEVAKIMIGVAKKAGVDCVKFQKRDIDSLLTKREQKRIYNSNNSMASTYGAHRKVMEFSEDDFKELQQYANELGLFFTASGWDKKSIDFLDELNVPFIKVASADLTNLPLLEHIAKKRKPIFLSTGMGNFTDVQKAHKIISKYEKRIVLFQCTSSYPAPYPEINLNVLTEFKRSYPSCVMGYSGHELGTLISNLAVALGAKVIEKHFTLNKNAIGSDHKAALNRDELGELVKNIKITEQAMGSSQKEVQPSEKSCIKKLCKSVSSLTEIKKGETITEQMITTKSPNVGIPANAFYNIIGCKAKRNIEEDTTLVEEDVHMKYL